MTDRHATSIVWFRRDLRLDDHVALERAARASARVVCAFVLDPPLLRGGDVGAPIVAFFFDALADLRATLRERGSDLALLEGDFATELGALAERTGATALYFNRDYEPQAIERDARVTTALRARGMTVEESLDHVYYGADEIRKADGAPYTVYTPYKRRWLERFEAEPRPPVPSREALARKLAPRDAIGTTREVPEPEEFGHARSSNYPRGGERHAREILDAFVAERIGAYAEARNVPAVPGTSHLSPHLRAGTIGIRTCVAAATDARRDARGTRATAIETWRGELIWRDFYQQIYANFPHVATGPFLRDAARLRYRESEDDFRAWCDGRTGYPDRRCGDGSAQYVRVDAQSFAHDRRVVSHQRSTARLSSRRGVLRADISWTTMPQPTTAGGNGRPRRERTRLRISASSTPLRRARNSIPAGRLSKKCCLRSLPCLDKAVHAPWTLAPLEAEALGFRLGRDYPEPIVDHAAARLRALAAYAPVLAKKRRRRGRKRADILERDTALN